MDGLEWDSDSSVLHVWHVSKTSETMDGVEWDSDPTAYVLSANVHRRHLSSSQKAMAYAMKFPEVRAGRKKKEISQNCEILSATEANNISRARFILKHDLESAV